MIRWFEQRNLQLKKMKNKKVWRIHAQRGSYEYCFEYTTKAEARGAFEVMNAMNIAVYEVEYIDLKKQETIFTRRGIFDLGRGKNDERAVREVMEALSQKSGKKRSEHKGKEGN